MKVTTVLQRVRRLLQDDNATQRWSDNDLLDCFNEAQLAVVQNRPDAYSKVVSFTCGNQSRQSLPAEVYRLMDVVDNESTGRSVTKTTRTTMDSLIVDWPVQAGTQVEQFIYDEKSPDVFYVYPVPPAEHKISIVVSQAPAVVAITDFATDTQTMELDAIWLNPLLNYLMFRAYLLDGETEQNMMQAKSYLQMFVNDLQLKWNVDQVFRQKRQRTLPEAG